MVGKDIFTCNYNRCRHTECDAADTSPGGELTQPAEGLGMLNVSPGLGMHDESAKECSGDQGFLRLTDVHRYSHRLGMEDGVKPGGLQHWRIPPKVDYHWVLLRLSAFGVSGPVLWSSTLALAGYSDNGP